MLHHHQHTLADHQEAVIDEIQAEGIDPGPPIEVPFLPPRGTLWCEQAPVFAQPCNV